MTASSRSDWALIPNWLSAGRIAAAAALPLMFLFFDRPFAETAALGLFVGAAATDFLDGWLARALGQTSALGAILDSLADKALLGATLLALGATSLMGAWWFWLCAAIIVAREVGVTWLRSRYGRSGALSVSLAAKWKTVLQMTAAALLLAVGPVGRWLGPEVGAWTLTAGAVALIGAAWLSVTSGYGYLQGALRDQRGGG
ncbi:MAG: CDP-alcohol phosphatidyltransferase family protein [Pseudomonadota bacterium]